MPLNTRHFRPAPARLDSGLKQAQCWEDEALVVGTLSGMGPVLSVIEGADSVIALALAGCTVRAVGSPSERALLELKLAGAGLAYSEHLQLMGALSGGRRLTLYHQLRGSLSPATRQYWDRNEATLRLGLLSSGLFERRLTKLRERVLPWVLPHDRLDELLSVRDLPEQRRVLKRLRGSLRWRALDGLARDMPGLRRHIELTLERELVHRCGALLWFFLGYYPDLELSGRRYLSAQGHAQLAKAAERVEVLEGALAQHLVGAAVIHLGRQPLPEVPGLGWGFERPGAQRLPAAGLLGPGLWLAPAR